MEKVLCYVTFVVHEFVGAAQDLQLEVMGWKSYWKICAPTNTKSYGFSVSPTYFQSFSWSHVKEILTEAAIKALRVLWPVGVINNTRVFVSSVRMIRRIPRGLAQALAVSVTGMVHVIIRIMMMIKAFQWLTNLLVQKRQGSREPTNASRSFQRSGKNLEFCCASAA